MDQDTPNKTNWLDGAAVVLSALCLVHCLALPLIIIGVPFLAQFAEGHLHLQMLVIVLPLSTLALGIGYRRHRNSRILIGGVVGMSLLIIGATVAHAQLGLIADRAFTICGSLTLATAHYFNSIRAQAACDLS
ncbi:MAG: MerC domain-containing protein [Woeseiaceae bacterium]|nr:MerC domain-containing protein [Woeseiaceae bacterium]MDX2609251.1 MerC domain-containing protein [Woeseiaceae bacterium]